MPLEQVSGYDRPSTIAASQAAGSRTVVTRRPSRLTLVDGTGSVAESGGARSKAYARRSVDVLTVAADCRRLRPRPTRIRLRVDVIGHPPAAGAAGLYILSTMTNLDGPYVTVHFRLEIEDDWPPASVESLWAVDQGDGTARLDNRRTGHPLLNRENPAH